MLNNTNKSLDFYLLLLYLCPRMQSYKEVKKRGREGFQRAGKRADHVAKDSSMLESVPATSQKIPACWKACRPRREGFQHAGKYFEYKFKLYI